MADDDTPPAGGKSILGDPAKKIAGVPQPIFIGGLVLGGAALLFWWIKRRKKPAATTATTTVITGSSSTGIDNAMLEAMLKDWQQHPGTTSGTTAASGTGTGSSSGGSAGGGAGPTPTSGTVTPAPTGPNTSTTTQETGSMHGITLAQAQYLYDTGNMPYVYDAATNEYVRWQGQPVAGQTFYAGPLNWQVNLQNGNITGGTAGHPTYKTAPKPATAAKPKTTATKQTASKPPPRRPGKKIA
jgi:hypothetical protein